MKKVTTVKLLKTARKLKSGGKPWHFHILSPGCTFNRNKQFALILEDSYAGVQYVRLFMKKPTKTGKKLVELLHGKGISKKSNQASSAPLSPKAKKIIERATELNNKGFSWHHHLLFPNCVFNKDPRYWTLVFEDPLNGEIIKDQSSREPKQALKKIEPLFYFHKK